MPSVLDLIKFKKARYQNTLRKSLFTTILVITLRLGIDYSTIWAQFIFRKRYFFYSQIYLGTVLGCMKVRNLCNLGHTVNCNLKNFKSGGGGGGFSFYDKSTLPNRKSFVALFPLVKISEKDLKHEHKFWSQTLKKTLGGGGAFSWPSSPALRGAHWISVGLMASQSWEMSGARVWQPWCQYDRFQGWPK